MANCHKCGATKLRKNSRKEYSCVHCGPKPQLPPVDGIIIGNGPLRVAAWRRMIRWLVTAYRRSFEERKPTVAKRPDSLPAAGLTKSPNN